MRRCGGGVKPGRDCCDVRAGVELYGRSRRLYAGAARFR